MNLNEKLSYDVLSLIFRVYFKLLFYYSRADFKLLFYNI